MSNASTARNEHASSSSSSSPTTLNAPSTTLDITTPTSLVIAIEGNIGVGKSTFISALDDQCSTQHIPCRALPEPINTTKLQRMLDATERWRDGTLGDENDDDAGNGIMVGFETFDFEVDTLLARQRQVYTARTASDGATYVMERSLSGDLALTSAAFAATPTSLSAVHENLYYDIFAWTCASHKTPDDTADIIHSLMDADRAIYASISEQSNDLYGRRVYDRAIGMSPVRVPSFISAYLDRPPFDDVGTNRGRRRAIAANATSNKDCDVIVYLWADEHTLWSRIENRARLNETSAYDLGRLVNIDNAYSEVLRASNCPVVVINWPHVATAHRDAHDDGDRHDTQFPYDLMPLYNYIRRVAAEGISKNISGDGPLVDHVTLPPLTKESDTDTTATVTNLVVKCARYSTRAHLERLDVSQTSVSFVEQA